MGWSEFARKPVVAAALKPVPTASKFATARRIVVGVAGAVAFLFGVVSDRPWLMALAPLPLIAWFWSSATMAEREIQRLTSNELDLSDYVCAAVPIVPPPTDPLGRPFFHSTTDLYWLMFRVRNDGPRQVKLRPVLVTGTLRGVVIPDGTTEYPGSNTALRWPFPELTDTNKVVSGGDGRIDVAMLSKNDRALRFLGPGDSSYMTLQVGCGLHEVTGLIDVEDYEHNDVQRYSFRISTGSKDPVALFATPVDRE